MKRYRPFIVLLLILASTACWLAVTPAELHSSEIGAALQAARARQAERVAHPQGDWASEPSLRRLLGASSSRLADLGEVLPGVEAVQNGTAPPPSQKFCSEVLTLSSVLSSEARQRSRQKDFTGAVQMLELVWRICPFVAQNDLGLAEQLRSSAFYSTIQCIQADTPLDAAQWRKLGQAVDSARTHRRTRAPAP